MSLLNEFCKEFGTTEPALGTVTRFGRRCFLTLPEQGALIAEKKRHLFGAGIFLGEEKQRFEPSPACVELISAAAKEHKVVVDEKAAWLFLCGRDIFTKGIVEQGAPTARGYLLVENERGENLGYGMVPKKRQKNVAVKNLLDRGFYLRRERLQ